MTALNRELNHRKGSNCGKLQSLELERRVESQTSEKEVPWTSVSRLVLEARCRRYVESSFSRVRLGAKWTHRCPIPSWRAGVTPAGGRSEQTGGPQDGESLLPNLQPPMPRPPRLPRGQDPWGNLLAEQKCGFQIPGPHVTKPRREGNCLVTVKIALSNLVNSLCHYYWKKRWQFFAGIRAAYELKPWGPVYISACDKLVYSGGTLRVAPQRHDISFFS